MITAVEPSDVVLSSAIALSDKTNKNTISENDTLLKKCNYHKDNNHYNAETCTISEIEFYKEKNTFLREKLEYLAKRKQEDIDNKVNGIINTLDELTIDNNTKKITELQNIVKPQLSIKIDRRIYLDYLTSPNQTCYTITNAVDFEKIPFYYVNPEFVTDKNKGITHLSQHATDDKKEHFMANDCHLYILNTKNCMVHSTENNIPITYIPIHVAVE